MRKQRGLSFIGFIFLLALIAAAAIVGFKITPVYVEFFSIKKMLASTAVEGREMQPAEIRRLFERKLAAEYVEAVTSADLEIGKDGGQVTLAVAYTRKTPLVANVSLLFEFQADSRR